MRVRARSIIGTRYRSTTSTRGVSSAVSGGVSSGVSSGVRKGEGLGERLCEFVRVGASSRELAGVRARSITSTRCCSTYGHFAQPMHMLLNRWTFCSPYGHPDEHNGRQKAAKRDAISWQAANKGVAGNGFPANPTKHPGRSGARAIKCDQIAKPSNSMPAKVWWKVQGKV